jgi:hypothetical protein
MCLSAHTAVVCLDWQVELSFLLFTPIVLDGHVCLVSEFYCNLQSARLNSRSSRSSMISVG